MNHLLFFSLFLSIFAIINIYISKRLIKKLDISDKAKQYLNIFLLTNLIGIVCYMFSRYIADIPNLLYFLFSIPIGILFLLFCTTVIYDISRVLLFITPLEDSRRSFLKKTLDTSSFLVASTLSIRSLYEAKVVQIQNVEIEIKKLKTPYKIIQISDLHIGGLIDRNFVKEIVEKINTLNPDVVVITGDLIDVDISRAIDAVAELTNLRSRFGTYYILGNHEYFHGVSNIITTVKSLGIKVLENENVYIGDSNKGFNLAGVYDMIGYKIKTYEPNLYDALKNKKDTPTVLLAHQPKFIKEVQGGVDLILCGHTHGGQIYPFRFLVSLEQPYISGLHKHNEDLQIYVNKGTGFWGPPMRLGASSEITLINLVPKDKQS